MLTVLRGGSEWIFDALRISVMLFDASLAKVRFFLSLDLAVRFVMKIGESGHTSDTFSLDVIYSATI